ncbi:hypothetical protein C8R45DRAFT_80957 [Mycena sanguinolenta]|nr:hypothetical protein C8R45DRAFT_80957 [Mycena sanguinolenta]
MTDIELAAFEAHIVATCADHMQWREKGYLACVSTESKESEYFIKYDNRRCLRPRNDAVVHQYATHHVNGPHSPSSALFRSRSERIPCNGTYRASSFFTYHRPRREDGKGSRMALEGPGSVLGPIGGGLIRHSFFKDYTAPLAFSSFAALERYMNKVRRS